MTYPYHPAISGPIAPYSNVQMTPYWYKPSRFAISAVGLGITTLVTTSVNHNYVIGQQVKLIIPPTYGCTQLNEQSGFVISIPSPNQIVLSIDSSKNVNPFIASSATTKAQTLAVGDVNTGPTNSLGRMSNLTYIPGSFQDISPAAIT